VRRAATHGHALSLIGKVYASLLPRDKAGKATELELEDRLRLWREATEIVALNREWKRALGDRSYASRLGTKAPTIKTRRAA
jgi:hypothetical protein